MFSFSSKTLVAVTLLLAAPVLGGCAVGTEPSEPSAAASASSESPADVHLVDGGTVLVGVKTPVVLRTAPNHLCEIYTDELDGPLLQTTELSDGEGVIHVTVEPDAPGTIGMHVKCENPKDVSIKHEYSYELVAVADGLHLTPKK